MFGRKEWPDERHVRQEIELSLRIAGFPPKEAATVASQHIDEAKQEITRAGLQNLGKVGDHMIANEKSGKLSPNDASMLAAARQDSVTDDDIRSWWDLPILQRQVMYNLNQTIRMTAMLSFLEQETLTGNDKASKEAAMERALRKCKSAMPWYGDPRLPKDAPAADRDLPHELRKRISDWFTEGKPTPPADSSTFNAYIRSLIRQGKI